MTDIGTWRGSDGALNEMHKWKYVSMPVNISCSIEGVTRQDFRTNYETDSDGYKYPILVTDRNFSSTNAGTEQIRIPMAKDISGTTNYFVFDLGRKNAFQSYNVTGGDTGGSNVEVTLEYENSNNDFVVYKGTSIYNIPAQTDII
jgi:hypothetical protein